MGQRAEVIVHIAARQLIVQSRLGCGHGGLYSMIGDVHNRLYHHLVIAACEVVEIKAHVPRNALYDLLVCKVAAYLLNVRGEPRAVADYRRQGLCRLFVVVGSCVNGKRSSVQILRFADLSEMEHDSALVVVGVVYGYGFRLSRACVYNGYTDSVVARVPEVILRTLFEITAAVVDVCVALRKGRNACKTKRQRSY